MKAPAGTRQATAGANFHGEQSSRPSVVAEPRTCIVVLGMHRSGTSALSRVLSILGAALPRHLMAAAAGNETGHWEPEKLVEFHDEMLAELDSAWDDWAALEVSRLTVRRREEIKRRIAEIINDEYGNASLMVVKDPRICRFAPLFLEALTDAGIMAECVLAFRHPLEVVRSLARRNGMPRGQASLLWLRHVLDSEAATRGKRRAVLFYSDLLTDWRNELRRVTLGTESGKGDVWPNSAEVVAEQIDKFLNPAQRHHVLSDAEIISDPIMSGWFADIHDALHQLRRNPAPASALATFDRVRCEFERAAPVIDQIQRDLRAQTAALTASLVQSRDDLRAQLSAQQIEVNLINFIIGRRVLLGLLRRSADARLKAVRSYAAASRIDHPLSDRALQLLLRRRVLFGLALRPRLMREAVVKRILRQSGESLCSRSNVQ
jgi:hypothetical protein